MQIKHQYNVMNKYMYIKVILMPHKRLILLVPLQCGCDNRATIKFVFDILRQEKILNMATPHEHMHIVTSNRILYK